MSGKLDQSLDAIVAARKKTNVRPRRAAPRRAASGAAKPAAAPVGGVRKNTKPANKFEKKTKVPTGPAKQESKILVSNLPSDVTEAQIKEYFQKTVDPVKKIVLSYGPNGQSRGIATVIFGKAASAVKAVKELNGVKVDSRPMRVEVILDARDAPVAPEPKKLSDRITQPKSQLKNASKPKPATAGKGAQKGAADGKKNGRNKPVGRARHVKKTAEQLDAEMTDYFQTGTGEATETNGAVQAAADTNMADDI